MESVLRGLSIYLFLMLVTRIAGRRTLSEMTSFDFVLLLIISEATQQALLGEDFSSMNAFVVIGTLILIDVGMSLLKRRFEWADKLLDGVPTVLVRDGKMLNDRVKRARLDRDEILEAARRAHGIAAFSEIEHAILERDGTISIIPKHRN